MNPQDRAATRLLRADVGRNVATRLARRVSGRGADDEEQRQASEKDEHAGVDGEPAAHIDAV